MQSLCDELITRPEESYRLWCVVVCDLETSRMRRPWPALGRGATGGKKMHKLPRVMKHYSPTGRKNHGRPLKRLLDTWDWNRSTSGPTPWQIDDDDDDDGGGGGGGDDDDESFCLICHNLTLRCRHWLISFKHLLLFVAYCFTSYLTVFITACTLLPVEGCALIVVDGVQICPFVITINP